MKPAKDLSSVAGTVPADVRTVPFPQIPGQTKLFTQYQGSPLSLQKYFPNVVANITDISAFVPTVLNNYTTDRDRLCNALLRINQDRGAGERTLRNIELLREPMTVAAVTGQQAGLFTGPIYTIYKALSAVKLAEHLNSKCTNAVAVFWAATEDHDFDEVSQAYVVDGASRLKELRSHSRHYTEGQSVGEIRLDESAEALVHELLEALPKTDLTGPLAESLKAAWKPGAYFGEAFERQLLDILDAYGVIVIDPLDSEIKRLVAPIYKSAIERSDELVDAVVARNAELAEAGFHAQVHVEENYFPLFWHSDDGRRLALKRTGTDTFAAAAARREFTRGQLLEIAYAEPERFSPGVMLRPVVQDHLLPTVCYFGGGAEIAYFAQNSEVYRVLERPVTPVFHRQSFTVIEPANARTMAKYELEFSDLFAGREAVEKRISDELLNRETAAMFAEVEERINTELNRLDRELSHLDPNLAKNLATRRRKIVYHIGTLRNKARAVQMKKHADAERRLAALFASMLPVGHLQERSINVVSFMDRYGPRFIEVIFQAIDLNDRGHRVIYL